VLPRTLLQETSESLKAVTVVQRPETEGQTTSKTVVRFKCARSPALSRDTNDEGLAFKTGVGSVNYFDTNQNRSLQVTSDGEQSLVILRTTWATVEKKITVS